MATDEIPPALRRAAAQVGPLTQRCIKCGGQEFHPPSQPGVKAELTCKACGTKATVDRLVQRNVSKEAKRLVDAEAAATAAAAAKAAEAAAKAADAAAKAAAAAAAIKPRPTKK